jgi:hypothetical protein
MITICRFSRRLIVVGKHMGRWRRQLLGCFALDLATTIWPHDVPLKYHLDAQAAVRFVRSGRGQASQCCPHRFRIGWRLVGSELMSVSDGGQPAPDRRRFGPTVGLGGEEGSDRFRGGGKRRAGNSVRLY